MQIATSGYVGILAAGLCSIAPLSAHADACGALKGIKLKDTVIIATQLVPAGPFKDASVPWAMPSEVPAHCELKGVITPTNESHIEFEVWLPISGWNGKLHGAGNGGFAGSITYHGGLVEAVQRGYAGASTDTGHRGENEGAEWAVGHPDRVVDFGHRAIHLMTVDAKAVVKAFYGSPAQHAYFSSCSNGGRQGLMEAQRYPEDYDGIVAGAPANDFVSLMLAFVWNQQQLSAADAAIPADRTPAIQAAVNAQCDALDGLRDGVIASPLACSFDPQKLACSGAPSAACLTSPQLRSLKSLYQGMRSSDGKIAFAGFSPGAEVGGWDNWIFGQKGGPSTQARFGASFMRGMAASPKWTPEQFSLDRDAAPILRALAPALNATDPDLSRFAARGGKLILFHGWSDPAVPPLNSVQYFDRVKASMGEAKRQSFSRLFMVPGMQHCFGGPGPSSFGGIAAARQPAEPDADLSAALERWVESGVAPESVKAVKPKNPLAAIFDSTRGGVERTGLICAYPKVAHFSGHGGGDDAGDFNCESPNTEKR
jgi:Tannase and feruloyl esterase